MQSVIFDILYSTLLIILGKSGIFQGAGIPSEIWEIVAKNFD